MALFETADLTRISSPRCDACKLHKGCKHPKMPPHGEGKRGVLIVAEAPGRQEDEQGIQLIGKAGQRLRETMNDLGWSLDVDCWKTNAVICRPPDNKMDVKFVDYCRPNLDRAIRDLNPRVIVLLGRHATESVVMGDWGDSAFTSLDRWVGWTIPSQSLNAWICPTWHPSYLLRRNSPALDLWFQRHLKQALDLSGRPWPDGTPKWENSIDTCMDPGVVSVALDRLVANKRAIAFDYETDRLKPDRDDARIVCCAVSDGEYTIAYPWVGDCVDATSRLLRSPVKKIAANLKFETRWSHRVLGHGVRNWYWDCMLASHVLDQRKSITSVKFQSYVRFGQPTYNNEVKPYLEAAGGANSQNRAMQYYHEHPEAMLTYCGMDALLEHKISMDQIAEMGEHR